MKKHREGKKRFIRINTGILALLFALSGGILAGCDNDGPAEEAGENIDEAMEDAGDAIEDAGDDDDDGNNG